MLPKRMIGVAVFLLTAASCTGPEGEALSLAHQARAPVRPRLRPSSTQKVSLAALSIRFSPISLKHDAKPRLSTGEPGIDSAQAISDAALVNPGPDTPSGIMDPGVVASAQYGLFSDDVMARVDSSGKRQLLYQNVPAWIVTFSGSGVSFQPLVPPGFSSSSTGVHHEESVVVDAQTGAYMEAFS